MKDRVFVDTSAWIVSFKSTGNEKLKEKLIEILDATSAATTNIVILELLQGCRDRKEYEDLKSRLEALDNLPLNSTVWETAYENGYALRRKGITVPTIDILIASIVHAHGCVLLHHDRHFELIAKPLKLRTVHFLA